jgi:excisionase family DNA binding protein
MEPKGISGELTTVDQAAERLGLHAKTVLRMIREGRLRATRIGKAYRILRTDLDALIGAPAAGSAPRGWGRATSIVDIDDLPVEAAARISSALQAALIGRAARPDPVHLDTAYDPHRRALKVVIIATPGDAAGLLQMLQALLDTL